MRTFKEMVLDLVSVLEKMNMDYAIIGGVAVSVWGNPRTTRDLDVIMVLKSEQLSMFLKELQEKGFSITREDIENALKERTHFTIFDTHSEYHVDAKGVYNEVDALTMKNRCSIRYEGHEMCVASAEDTVAHKLLFGGHQDSADAESILVRQPAIDGEYLRELCEIMGVSEELEAMMRKVENLNDTFSK